MFDFDVGKLLLIGVVALIFIPPKDLPEALRQIGRLVGQARRMAGDFQNQFNEAIREAELTDLKDEFNQMKKTASLEGALAHVAEAIEPLEFDRQGEGHAVAGRGHTRSIASARTSHHPAGRLASATRACGKRRGGKSFARKQIMTQADIDASKAPLIDHLIELRARLIKALAAFLVAFVVCFYFSHHIYNILLGPYVSVVGAENAKLIATHFLEQFFTQLKLSMFGAAFIAFPIIALQIYKFVTPGLYSHERQAFAPYLIATPVFFFWARCWSISWSCPC